MRPFEITSWQPIIPAWPAILREIESKTTIAVGVQPYPRIIPALFLRNYAIYCVHDLADFDSLRPYCNIVCLEDRHPTVAAKVHATNYLIRNYSFQAFLKSRRQPYRLLFYQTTKKIVEALKEFHIEWIGNDPESFSGVLLKGDFRQLIKSRGLPSLPDWRLSREEFLKLRFNDLWAHWSRAFVVQRADFDVAGELGTFFVRTEQDWQSMHDVLANDERYHFVTLSPYIVGNSFSMLGCITVMGVLTSTLQLQFIDVPEALAGQPPTGVFLGHDWGYDRWPRSVEQTAQRVVESVGAALQEKGYKGIFGVDFIADEQTSEIFPIECNPRFTGALPLFSLMTLWTGGPPIELFHFMSHLGLDNTFDFAAANAALKVRRPLAHLSLTPKGIYEMKLPLAAGIYSFGPDERSLRFERLGAFPWECKNENEFIIIDSVPRPGSQVIQNVPRLCKLIFPRQIAESSFRVDPKIGRLFTNLSVALRKDQRAPAPPSNQIGP